MSDWKPQRLQPDPSENAVRLRAEVRDQALSCYGIPPASVGQSASGLRESGSHLPTDHAGRGACRVLELSAKMDHPYEVRFGPAPADVSLMARGLSIAVEGGLLTKEQAQRILGV